MQVAGADANNDGRIDEQEFRKLSCLQLTSSDIAEAFKAIDTDGSGGISVLEFSEILTAMGYSFKEVCLYITIYVIYIYSNIIIIILYLYLIYL